MGMYELKVTSYNLEQCKRRFHVTEFCHLEDIGKRSILRIIAIKVLRFQAVPVKHWSQRLGRLPITLPIPARVSHEGRLQIRKHRSRFPRRPGIWRPALTPGSRMPRS